MKNSSTTYYQVKFNNILKKYHEQVGFITEIQKWFNIPKSIVTHDIKTLKNKII